YGPHRSFTVQANGQLRDAAAYRPIVVAYRNGRPVRLEDLGRVVNSVEDNKTGAWYIDQRSVVLAVQRQPGTNTVEVAAAVRKLLPTFQKELPASVSLNMLHDRSESIKASVNDVKFTLMLALCLVVLVIFLFLRNLSATIIPALALPMSIIGTFVVMYELGYSLDNLSLMALTLAVGFVVDDAIVMLENIVRHMEMGEPPFQAALKGAREIGFTIVSMTLALSAVFIPVLFMGGILGRLFHEFAVTIGAAVLVSGFVSLTLTPMLCSRFLRPPSEEKHGRFYQATEDFLNRTIAGYGTTLDWVIDHRRLAMAVLAATLVLTGYLFVVVPKGFIPAEDQGSIFIQAEGAEGASYQSMVRHMKELMAIIHKQPEVQEFMTFVGARGGTTTGFAFLHLKPLSERDTSVDQLIDRMRPEVAEIPGLNVFMQNPPPLRIGGRPTKSQYQFTLQGPDTKELYHWSTVLQQKMEKLPGLIDVTSDLKLKSPQVLVDINRDKAATLGVSALQIEDALYSAYGERRVSTIYAPNNEYQVLLELEPAFQDNPDALNELFIRSTSGNLVPLESVANIRRGIGPLTVNHSGQLPAVTLSFDLAPGTSLGDATTAVNKLAVETLPGDISTGFQGTAQAFQSSIAGMGLLLLMAILVIYMVLGILYESFIHPLTILSALPLAGFGALVTLEIFRTDLSLYAFVGIIMLVGLVKKNGIMMVDFAIE
ncbi:MAG TPA: efflux RND transporter permease subunit, partial [Thermoanaerobaculia bacterium]|nr:efflux RND transporter permease subunit [Thermoanaerobaculia bacterium]